MTLLTDKQRDEVVEAMARAVFLRRNGMATCWAWDEGGLDDEHPGAREQYLKDATAALTAALPAIERAVLERAAKADKREAPTIQPVGSGALHGEQQYCFERGWDAGRKSMRKAIRALAGEVG